MTVRMLGQLVECVHAPVYFAPEPQRRYAELGLRGYWRGYFASRAAALGTASAETVTTLFGGFAPTMVERAIPEVWTITSPAAASHARQTAAVEALSRLVTSSEPDVVRAADEVARVVDSLDTASHPMAAAHASLPRPEEPLAALWHGCTVLREYRGDAHLAVLRDRGLPWPQPHVLLLGAGRVDVPQRDYRGWSPTEWNDAEAVLRDQGLFATADGLALIEAIDAETDQASAGAFSGHDVDRLIALLTPIATQTVVEVPFPNAMGLLRPAVVRATE